MTITVYKNFSKRKNSTKQPTGGTSVTCTLKETTSVEKPTFILSGNDFTINYVKAFSHYYFVEDIRSVRNGLIEISCSMDVLATHKSAILSYTAFVERSDSWSNPMIADPYVVMYNGETVDSNVEIGPFNSTGYYCISVLNDLGSKNGFCTYYLTSADEIENLAQYVNTDWGSSATAVLDWLQATFLKTADSIIDCIWIPIAVGALPSSALSAWQTMKIGVDWVTGASGYRVTDVCVASDSVTITIPHVYTDFRKASPYTTVKLYIPGYGVVDVNPLDFDDDKIYLKFSMDCTTGDTMCYMYNDAGDLIATFTYNMGVQCPVGKVAADVTGTVGGLISTVGSLALAGVTKGAAQVGSEIGAVSSGINTLASALGPTASVNGGKGGRAIVDYGLNVVCTVICKDTSDPDELLGTHGKPWMRESNLGSTFSGYVKCSNASVPISGMGSEKDELNGYLNSGFYIE